MAVELKQFVKRLTGTMLMSADEVRAFLDGLPPDEQPRTGKELAEQLVRHMRLTAFQAQAVYDGKGEGLVLGNYVILERIGQGGMGTVYKAQHREMKREVAIKVLAPHLTKTPEGLKRFRREVRAAAALNHPHIVTAYDAAESKGARYLVMEYVDGADLASVVKTTGPLPVSRAVQYVLQVARALEYAHSKGIIHRDIKPSNLLVDRQDNVKILDLGLARIQDPEGATSTDSSLIELTKTGMVLGTVDYMPPEQALGAKDIDHRADIYSLGISLYYLLTARVPYEGSTLLARFLAHREQEIPSLQQWAPDAPDSLDRVFRKMVAKEAQDRYASMSEVVVDLEACLAGLSTSPVTAASPEPDSAWLEVLEAAAGASAASAAARAASPAVAEAPPIVELPEAAMTMPKARAETQQTSRAKRVQLLVKSLAQPWGSAGTRILLGSVGGALLLLFVVLLFLFSGNRNTIGMNLVLIPAGEFLMGSPESDSSAWDGEKPQHLVRISRPFYLGVTEVTQAQYEGVMGTNPSRFKGAQLPVEGVSWEDAVAFCRRLSDKEDRTYRLPTEAEWEYACRAGSTTKWSFGDDESALNEYAWYSANSNRTMHPVGEKNPNAWGLYDMHGNVCEWCSDWCGRYASTVMDDPTGPTAGWTRVLRGGSCYYDARSCRSVFRFESPPDVPGDRDDFVGFRVASSSVDASSR